ncbi:MAG TPA: helix-turn-helix domain-containing protein [Acetobacteraceae bacterium]|nr:helix-turn-helix domain-containing protein [Acetobacteraceae bacterium]
MPQPAWSERIRRIDAHNDGSASWCMTRVAPPPHLAGAIRGYSVYWERTGSFSMRRELPGAEAVMIVNLGAPIALTGGDGGRITLAAGEAFIAGAHLRPAFSASTGSQQGVHVHMPLIGLRQLLGMPLDKLTDRTVRLDDILPSAFCRDLSETQGRSNEELIALLDAALAARLAATRPLDPAQRTAIELLRRRPDLDIADIAADIGWSRKHLADRTRDATGVGPRSFRRLLRFQHLTALLRQTRAPSMAALAQEAGYCDQSHMNREFREFAAMTPGTFLARSLPNGGGLVEA